MNSLNKLICKIKVPLDLFIFSKFKYFFKVELENVPLAIDKEDIELVFEDPNRYGSDVKIKNIEKFEINERLNRFIIEYESEEGILKYSIL